MRTYRNGEEYAKDAAELAKEGWRPVFEPTQESHWRMGVRGPNAGVTATAAIATAGLSLLVPTKKSRLTVTYQRSVPPAEKVAVQPTRAPTQPMETLPAAIPTRVPTSIRIETDVKKYWGYFHKKQFETEAETRAKDGWRVTSVVPIKTWGNDGLLVTYTREVYA